MFDLGAPALGRRPGEFGQPCGGGLQFGSAGPGGGDQLAIEMALLVLPAAVVDGACPLLGQAPAVAPSDPRRSRQGVGQGVGPPQEPRHDPHRVP